MGKVYAAAREKHGESELLDELVASPPAIDRGQVEGAGGDLAAATKQGLENALRLVEEKGTPEEVDAYKRFVMSVAQAAASAHKEGGFLGIGGKEVSEAEDQALDEISTTLGEPPAA
jgi:hypothetical protein